MRYTLEDFATILQTTLPQDVLDKINFLIQEFKNVPQDQDFQDQDSYQRKYNNTDPQKYKKQYSHKKTPFLPLNKKPTDTLQPPPIPFKATIIEKKEGIDKLINDIKVALNKISAKNYEQQKESVLQTIQSILDQIPPPPSSPTQPTTNTSSNNTNNDEIINKNKFDILDDDSDEDDEDQDTITTPSPQQPTEHNTIIQSIFDIASSNKFYSQLYAQLYHTILQQYDFLHVSNTSILSDYIHNITNVDYADSDKDYDRYCAINKQNDKRKALTTFISHLTKLDVLNYNETLQIIEHMIQSIMATVDEENKTHIVDEITENLFIVLSILTDKTQKDNDTQWENQPQFIEQFIKTQLDNIKQLASYKVKEHKSISSRAIFKLGDIVKLKGIA